MAQEVDVVILSLNRKDSILQTIENVLSQLGISQRIWIVDQGSDPSTLEAVRRISNQYPQVFLQELGENLGVAAGRNIGMAKGSADYIVSIDNDAIFASEHEIAHAINRFAGDPALGAIGFRIRNYFTGDDDRSSWVYPRSMLRTRDQEFFATRYCGAGHALLRKAVAKTKGYDEGLFFFWEELDLSYQLIEAGHQIIYDPTISVLHKIDPEARTRWTEKRFYYYVRNAIYLDWKYFQSITRATLMAIGYILKGVYNRVPIQAFRGVRDSLGMIKRLSQNEVAPLGEDARSYIYEHDLKHRGSIVRRIREEVIERIPN